MPDAPQRLSKIVAALVPCSRREAEQYIAEGWVRVDGQVVQEPQFRVAGEQVDVDPHATLQPVAPATLLVHKPAGMGTAQARALVGAASHWEGDTSGIRRVRSHDVGLVPLLELPALAEGLTVFSQDGRIVRKLREDARLLEQELVAQVSGTLVEGGLARLCDGLVVEGRRLPPARVSWAERGPPPVRGEGHRSRDRALDVRAGRPGAARAEADPHRPRAHGRASTWPMAVPGTRDRF